MYLKWMSWMCYVYVYNMINVSGLRKRKINRFHKALQCIFKAFISSSFHILWCEKGRRKLSLGIKRFDLIRQKIVKVRTKLNILFWIHQPAHWQLIRAISHLQTAGKKLVNNSLHTASLTVSVHSVPEAIHFYSDVVCDIQADLSLVVGFRIAPCQGCSWLSWQQCWEWRC